jgi:isocitrate dehydrogenase
MDKIKMKTPIVELNGDEMARILWGWVKDKLIEPYVDLKTEYFDLYIKNRDNTDDRVTIDAANAIKKYGVGVKCATITPNKDRQKEYNLKEMWKSPNGTIRKILNGTVFRTPITIESITPIIPGWTKPITVARHSYGDAYLSTSLEVNKGTKVEFVLTDENGKESRQSILEFHENGILMGQYNIDSSIEDFAHTCFKYALQEKCDLLFGAKDTVTKTYDYKFKDIFQELYDNEYKNLFEKHGIKYSYTLIDDAISRVIKSNGGMIWACKNYDGDLMSDMVATGFGSLALMTSVLVSPEGYYEFEAAHGTVKNHYYKHLKGENTSTNPIAIIFAWSGALRKRGEIDANENLINFANKLEEATINTINNGIMTKDLVNMSTAENSKWVSSEEMISAIANNLQVILN